MMAPNSMSSRVLNVIASSTTALDLRAITLTIDPKASDADAYRAMAPTISTTLTELLRLGLIQRSGQRRYYRFQINPNPPDRVAKKPGRKPSPRPVKVNKPASPCTTAIQPPTGFTDIDRAQRKAQALAALRRAEDQSLRGLKPRSAKAKRPETIEEFFARGGRVLKLPMHATANPLGGDYSQNPKHSKRRGTAYPKRTSHP